MIKYIITLSFILCNITYAINTDSTLVYYYVKAQDLAVETNNYITILRTYPLGTNRPLISLNPITKQVNSSGYISFYLLRNSIVSLKTSIYSLHYLSGNNIYIPDVDTVELSTTVTSAIPSLYVVAIPHTILRYGNDSGAVNQFYFLGNGVSVTRHGTSYSEITITSGGHNTYVTRIGGAIVIDSSVTGMYRLYINPDSIAVWQRDTSMQWIFDKIVQKADSNNVQTGFLTLSQVYTLLSNYASISHTHITLENVDAGKANADSVHTVLVNILNIVAGKANADSLAIQIQLLKDLVAGKPNADSISTVLQSLLAKSDTTNNVRQTHPELPNLVQTAIADSNKTICIDATGKLYLCWKGGSGSTFDSTLYYKDKFLWMKNGYSAFINYDGFDSTIFKINNKGYLFLRSDNIITSIDSSFLKITTGYGNVTGSIKYGMSNCCDQILTLTGLSTSGYAGAIFRIIGNTTGGVIALSNNINTWGIGYFGNSASDLRFNYSTGVNVPSITYDGALVTFKSNGFVGIGTVNPKSKLQILNGAIRADSILATYGVFTNLNMQTLGTVAKIDSTINRIFVIDSTNSYTLDSMTVEIMTIKMPKTHIPKVATTVLRKKGFIDLIIQGDVSYNSPEVHQVSDLWLVSDSLNNVNITGIEIMMNGTGGASGILTPYTSAYYYSAIGSGALTASSGGCGATVKAGMASDGSTNGYKVLYIMTDASAGCGNTNMYSVCRVYFSMPSNSVSNWFIKAVSN